jgi:hypothetical protein
MLLSISSIKSMSSDVGTWNVESVKLIDQLPIPTNRAIRSSHPEPCTDGPSEYGGYS